MSGQRHYTPELARWTRRDPLEEWGGTLLYAFCQNTVLDHVDPLGLFSFGRGRRGTSAPKCCKKENIEAEGERRAREARLLTEASDGGVYEYCGLVCCKDDGTVTSTDPHIGWVRGKAVDYEDGTRRVRCSVSVCNPRGTSEGDNSIQCSTGHEVGNYHSHPYGGRPTPTPPGRVPGYPMGDYVCPDGVCKNCSYCGFIGGAEGWVCKFWPGDPNRQPALVPPPPPSSQNRDGRI